jgi:hypothetical protein
MITLIKTFVLFPKLDPFHVLKPSHMYMWYQDGWCTVSHVLPLAFQTRKGKAQQNSAAACATVTGALKPRLASKARLATTSKPHLLHSCVFQHGYLEISSRTATLPLEASDGCAERCVCTRKIGRIREGGKWEFWMERCRDLGQEDGYRTRRHFYVVSISDRCTPLSIFDFEFLKAWMQTYSKLPMKTYSELSLNKCLMSHLHPRLSSSPTLF